MIEANWIAFALALAIGLLVAWWLFGRMAKSERRAYRPDVLDEGAAPARRNQALIDAPSAAATAVPQAATAASLASTGPDTMAGLGEIVGAAAADEVAEATLPPRAPQPNPPSIETDDLRRIKGLGPKLVTLLADLDITRFSQIAAWTDADIDRIDAQLGAFAGRIRRDSWVEQARYLAAGDTAGFEARFGKL